MKVLADVQRERNALAQERDAVQCELADMAYQRDGARAEVERLAKERDELAQWKESAMIVMTAWDAVYGEATKYRRAQLGGSRAEETLVTVRQMSARVGRLTARNAELVAEIRRSVCTENCTDPHHVRRRALLARCDAEAAGEQEAPAIAVSIDDVAKVAEAKGRREARR
jgi:hypothetical protein